MIQVSVSLKPSVQPQVSAVTWAMRRGRIARLLTDPLNPKWDYQPRSVRPNWEGLSSPPQTVTFNEIISRGKGSKVPLTPWMDTYFENLNGEDAWKRIKIPAAGWINTSNNPEALSWGGNDIIVMDILGGYANVYALDCYTESLSETWNTPNGRLVIHKFTAITRHGAMIKLANGQDVYTPFMKNSIHYWIPKEYIELWPALPVVVIGKNFTVYRVVEYELLGHETWGITDNGQRVCLYRPGDGYMTDWKIETPAPPV